MGLKQFLADSIPVRVSVNVSVCVWGGCVLDGATPVSRELGRPPTAQLRPIAQTDFDRAISKMKESKSHTGGLLSVDDMLD